MHTISKLEKLIVRVEKLIETLRLHPRDLHIHNNVNDFYYMQKMEELKLLMERIKETETRLKFLEDKFESAYKQVSSQLRKDTEFVNTAIHAQKKELEIKS